MKYFALRSAPGKVYPQSQEMISALSIHDKNHLWNLYGELPDEVYIPDSILHPRAKLTDLISSSPIMYPIVSDKLKQILERYRSQGVQYIPANVIVKHKKVSYWLVNGFDRDYKLIDFKKSIIEIVHRNTNNRKVVDISSASILESAIKEAVYPEYIWIKKLVLVENINQHLVLIDKFDYGTCLFSEIIKKEIEDAGCTGVRFDPIGVQRYT